MPKKSHLGYVDEKSADDNAELDNGDVHHHHRKIKIGSSVCPKLKPSRVHNDEVMTGDGKTIALHIYTHFFEILDYV